MKIDKTVTPDKLARELEAAGIQVRGLGTDGDDLHTYDEDGAPVDLPAGAGAIVNAHVADPPPVPLGDQLATALLQATSFDEAKPILAAILRGQAP
jgi:hypothetical protein